MNNHLLNLEKKIGITFTNKKLLENVLVHRSFLNEHKKFPLPSNEKLEFLGDSVLSLVTSIYLYKNYPTLDEGSYTDIKAAIVRTESLAETASLLGLGKFIYLSKGEEINGGRTNKNILADTFEALVAAIFIDKNFETAYRFIVKFLFGKKLDYIIKNKLYLSPKSRLQEYAQSRFKRLPEYKIIEEKGPEHKKNFFVAVYLNGRQLATGSGHSKKEAEETAAKKAIERIISQKKG
ncbi:MAG: ribonuclease III [Microgenomates group bacterium]|nr:ribonuclease III [Microgenomates group bacterium]